MKAQCRKCDFWVERNGNTCFPRALTYVLSPINETAMPAHQATFGVCHFRTEGNEEVLAILGKNKIRWEEANVAKQ